MPTIRNKAVLLVEFCPKLTVVTKNFKYLIGSSFCHFSTENIGMIAILGKPDATSLTLRHSGVDARAIITSRLVCSAPASQTVFQVLTRHVRRTCSDGVLDRQHAARLTKSWPFFLSDLFFLAVPEAELNLICRVESFRTKLRFMIQAPQVRSTI